MSRRKGLTRLALKALAVWSNLRQRRTDQRR
jgi:hypothetical protein